MFNSIRLSPILKQTWCASAIWIALVAQGMLIGFSTTLLSGIKEPSSSIKTDIHSESWLVSSIVPASIIGILCSGFLMDRYGRRITYMLTLIPVIIGLVLMYFAQNYVMLLIGRIMTGMTNNAIHTVGYIVLGELICPKYRGIFLNLKTSAASLGILIVHILGNFFHWRTIMIITLIPYVLPIFIIYTWPESPTWLASKSQFEKCKREFIWLRGNSEQSIQEFNDLIEMQKERQTQLPKITFLEKIKEYIQQFKKKDFLKPLFVAFCACILMESSGRHYFPTYALQILSDVTNSNSQPYYYVICFDFIVTLGSLCSSVLIKLLNRRTLLFSTAIASVIIQLALCTYLYLVSENFITDISSWVVISMLVLYFFLTSLGCSPVPFAICGEIFPSTHKESASTITGIVSSLYLLILLKSIPYLIQTIKIYGTFLIFSAITTIMLIILYFTLPETKNRTLPEIEFYFINGKFRNDYCIKTKL